MLQLTDQELRLRIGLGNAEPGHVQQVINDLRAGATHIELYGWTQGSNFLNPGRWWESPCCALGSLRWVCWSERDVQPDSGVRSTDAEIDRIYAADKMFTHLWGTNLPNYNDQIFRTRDDVVFAMRQTADKLQQLLAGV